MQEDSVAELYDAIAPLVNRSPEQLEEHQVYEKLIQRLNAPKAITIILRSISKSNLQYLIPDYTKLCARYDINNIDFTTKISKLVSNSMFLGKAIRIAAAILGSHILDTRALAMTVVGVMYFEAIISLADGRYEDL